MSDELGSELTPSDNWPYPVDRFVTGLDLADRGASDEQVRRAVQVSLYQNSLDMEFDINISITCHGRMNLIGRESNILLPINKGTKKIIEKSVLNVPAEVKSGSVDDHDVFILHEGGQ